MRELKFRSWCDKHNKMDYFRFETMFLHEYSWCSTSDGSGIDVNDGRPIMQYTGLKDKNDKDIYEGDIVTLKKTLEGFNDIEYIVEYKIGGFCVRPINFDEFCSFGYMFYQCVSVGIFESCFDCDGSIFKVIGNIHEDKELIK